MSTVDEEEEYRIKSADASRFDTRTVNDSTKQMGNLLNKDCSRVYGCMRMIK